MSKVAQWFGCYESRWEGVITPESFVHPAKFSRGLIERIYAYLVGTRRLWPGDLVGDPFGGIGTGGIVAAYRGLRWVGVELEPRFVKLATDNFGRHAGTWRRWEKPVPVMLPGDSRHFDELVGPIAGVVCSPPYAQTGSGGGGKGINVHGYKAGPGRKYKTKAVDKVGERTYQGALASRSAGNIEKCKLGALDAVVGSPPYAPRTVNAPSKSSKRHRAASGRDPQSPSWSATAYGKAPGQIARLGPGSVSAVVTSPPWETNVEGGIKKHKMKFIPEAGKGHYGSPEARLRAMEKAEERVYGTAAGQIGAERGETYWEAVAQVYAAVYRALRPGGWLVLVVKDYVKNKQRVCLCDDTVRLLEHLGFETVERIHAMLVSEERHPDLFIGESVKRSERKGFFRRLAEKKGSPPIDYEEVIFATKPL